MHSAAQSGPPHLVLMVVVVVVVVTVRQVLDSNSLCCPRTPFRDRVCGSQRASLTPPPSGVRDCGRVHTPSPLRLTLRGGHRGTGRGACREFDALCKIDATRRLCTAGK